MNKHSPEYSNMARKHAAFLIPGQLPRLRTSSHDDIPSGLDALLAVGSSGSPHYVVETGGVSRVASHGSMPSMMAESADNLPSNYPYYLPKRESMGSINYHQAGLNLDEDSFNSSTSSEPPHSRSKSMDHGKQDATQSQPQLSLGGIGSLLEQHGSAYPETDFYRQRNHPQHLQNHFVQGGRNVSHQMSNQRNGTLIEHVGAALELGDSMSSTHSNSMMYEFQYDTPPTVDPQQKKVFTVFHNQARFARDATSAFLGSEGTPSPIHNDTYLVRHTLVPSSGFSMPFQGNFIGYRSSE
jgi:hypothetical protein